MKNKKGFKPPLNRDKNLEDYIACLKKSANSNTVEKRGRSNISSYQRKAIQDLKNDSSIIIKQADKGGAIVVMDVNHYKQMALEQLHDTNFYEKRNENEDRRTKLKVEKLIVQQNNNLTKNEIDYLKNYEVKTSNFYGLPKIHKSKEIEQSIKECNRTYVKIPAPTDLKLRPIIAGPSSSTQRLSNLLDILLKPLCQRVPSFIRDDMDF